MKIKVFRNFFGTHIQNPGGSSLTKVLTRDCLSLIYSSTEILLSCNISNNFQVKLGSFQALPVYSVANSDASRRALATPDILIMCWKTVTVKSAHATKSPIEQVQVTCCNQLSTYGAANVRPCNSPHSTVSTEGRNVLWPIYPPLNIGRTQFGKYSVVCTADWSKKDCSHRISS